MKTVLFFMIPLILFLTGCAGTQDKYTTPKYSKPDPKITDRSKNNKIKGILYSQLKEWKSVKYKTGGLSKRGIDCSGFVFVTYMDRFRIKLPRTTELQSRLGRPIAKSRLKAGDLVFFKTGVKVRHVGIYIENGKFIHASTSRGVMMSSFDDSYWSKKYWKSIRIL